MNYHHSSSRSSAAPRFFSLAIAQLRKNPKKKHSGHRISAALYMVQQIPQSPRNKE